MLKFCFEFYLNYFEFVFPSKLWNIKQRKGSKIYNEQKASRKFVHIFISKYYTFACWPSIMSSTAPLWGSSNFHGRPIISTLKDRRFSIPQRELQ